MPLITPSLVWNLQTIIQEFRSVTGIPDVDMYSDDQCAQLINYFYQFVLPKELKIFWGYTNYQFFTQANIDQYLAPVGFQTVNPSVTADGFPIEWYIDPDTFYQDWPSKDNKLFIQTADGINNSFSATVSAYPVLPRSLYVTDGTQVVQDDGAGGFNQVSPLTNVGPVSGSIDYLTGTFIVSFLNTPAVNSSIVASYFTYQPNRPQAILFYPQQPLLNSTQAALNAVNMFVLRPVPKEVYLIKMHGIQIPNPMINYTDVPFRPDLGPLIALGAALHRFKLFNQMDQYAQYEPEYRRFKDVSMQDTYEELLYERSIPKF
jgi:hypothetical protein